MRHPGPGRRPDRVFVVRNAPDKQGFEPVEPDLKDVYFSVMKGHHGARRERPEVAS